MKDVSVRTLLFGLLLWAVPLSAATAAEPTRLDEVVVTATKYNSVVRDIPASVSVIHGEDLEAQNLPNGDIGDALRSVTGISLRRAYAPFPASANIRGVGSGGTVYLVNGIPTNWQIVQTIPKERIARVEIIRGPASALYGANATGGVINILLKEGGKDFRASLSGGAGSFGRVRSAAAAEGARGGFTYAGAAFYEEADGTNVVKNNVNPSVHMIGNCNYDKHGVGFSAGYRFSDATRIRTFYNFFNDRYTRGRPHVGGDWDYHLAGVILDQKLGSRIDLKGYLAYRSDDYLHLYDKSNTNYDPNMKRFTDYSEMPAEIQATAKFDWGHTVTAGFFYNDQQTDQDYNNWQTGNLLRQNRYKVRTLAGYAQDVWKPMDALSITAGVRYDQWENYDNYFSNFTTPNPADRTDEHFSPKLGLRYNLADGTSVWASYGMGFAPPTSTQLYDDRTSGGNPRQPNPDLAPETTHSYEIGAERWFANLLKASLAGFYTVTDDKILSWFNAGNTWVNQNIGRSVSYGTELAVAIYPSTHWSVDINYTYNKATIDENPQNRTLEGKFLTFSPEHKANLGLTYSQAGNYTLSGYLRYLGVQYCNDANDDYNAAGEQLSMDASMVVDLKGTKQIRIDQGGLARIDLSLSVDNLFDENYRSFYMYEDPGTTLYGEVKLVF